MHWSGGQDDEFFTIFSFIFWPLFLLGLAFVCVGVFFLMSDDYLKIKKIISVPANLFCSVIRFVMKMVEKSWGFIYKTWRHFTFDRKIRKARKEVLDALVKQGTLKSDVVKKAFKLYGIRNDKPNPVNI